LALPTRTAGSNRRRDDHGREQERRAIASEADKRSATSSRSAELEAAQRELEAAQRESRCGS
jgi:primosomal protein N''